MCLDGRNLRHGIDKKGEDPALHMDGMAAYRLGNDDDDARAQAPAQRSENVFVEYWTGSIFEWPEKEKTLLTEPDAS